MFDSPSMFSLLFDFELRFGDSARKEKTHPAYSLWVGSVLLESMLTLDSLIRTPTPGYSNSSGKRGGRVGRHRHD